jgi:hypothetical protein
VSFYIKPADGFELPEIMQWIKQTYACRYNVYDGRTGHIWGDRYESEIVEGEPPESGSGRGDCGESGGEERTAEVSKQISKAHPREGPPGGDSHRHGEPAGNTGFSPHFPRRAAP